MLFRSLFIHHVLRTGAAAAEFSAGTGGSRNSARRMAVVIRALREAESLSRGKLILLLTLAAVAVLFVWGFTRKSAPPPIPFTKATRATVISSLSTNGKVEPIEWASARAERAGVVQKVFIQRGQQVRQGAELVALDVSSATSELAAASASIAQAQAQQQVLQQGGPQLERTQIENQLATARVNLRNARKEIGRASCRERV